MSDFGDEYAPIDDSLQGRRFSLSPNPQGDLLSPEALAEAEVRGQGQTDYTYEVPESGTAQRDVWDAMVARGFIDSSAVPGSPHFPIFEKQGRAPPPSDAAWVGLDGGYHTADGVYSRIQPETPFHKPEEAPFSALGTAESALTGLGGAVGNMEAHLNPLNPHGWADDLEALTALGGWAARDTHFISDDDYQDLMEREAKFRHDLPYGVGDTTDEMQRNAGLYHTPQNRTERIALDVAATLPALAGPEFAEAGGVNRLTQMAERAVMKQAGREEAYKTGLALTRGARLAAPIAGSLAGQEAATLLGGDEADQNAGAAFGGMFGFSPFKVGPRPARFGDRWNLKSLTPDQIYDVSTQGLPSEAIPSTLEAARRSNAYSYYVDGMKVVPTKGPLRTAANRAIGMEKRAAIRRGKPYVFQVGHAPDTTLSGLAEPPMGWIDQHEVSNSKWGGGLAHRQGDQIKVFKVDGVAHGLPSRYDGMAYYALMGTPLARFNGDDSPP